MLTESHRQRNWRQGDVVRNRGAARPIATRAARHRAAVRANKFQPRIRLNLINREPSLPAGTGSELSIAAQAARTTQILRAFSRPTDELRRRILEPEAANNGLWTQVSEFAEAETKREVETDGLRGRKSELETANNGLTAKVVELERAATDQAIEKLILKDRTELLEATLATRNRQRRRE
ncbi:uncharacterized protein Bfra_003646 [Botrytis fragariae]|uniref:Uncharacterized protein n=1 Tax=Botrytis fragariae TaxID=1964551 RepID=A0A8H6EK37_9HELO|nr:uncharacterized protein Bfra_003646 [Botrytis fragariae]KAF5875193.1 hypothetical protein Bfra_003646 [Botrytis fragariae]